MTSDLRAAAQQALEALEDIFGANKVDVGAINALRAALAEPVPVAWRWGYRSVTTGEMDWRGYVEIAADPNLRSPEIIMQPLYTAPPQRKPLTDEEIDELLRTMGLGKWSVNWLCRAIERAHGIT